MASVHGDRETRALAHRTLKDIARIGTHLFHWAEYRKAFGGWGAGARKAVQHWYLDRTPEQLGYQLIKYKSRDGWAHGDLLRKAHPATSSRAMNALFKYALEGSTKSRLNALTQVRAAQTLAKVTDVKKAVDLIVTHNLPREAVPTELLNEVAVWDALLTNMPMTAMIRNLGKMSSIGLLKTGSTAAKTVVERLKDVEALVKARIHPIAVLAAFATYESGSGFRGSLSWTPVRSVVDALDSAFYKSFRVVQPTGKRLALALDISSSMDWSHINGLPMLTARDGAAAMSLVTANVEDDYAIGVFATYFKETTISPRQRLDGVRTHLKQYRFGGTDCAKPITSALEQKREFDAFIIYTDNETWAGNVHPFQALKRYRDKMGIPAKLIVVGMASNNFTIADPKDAGMLDVVGFDATAPNVISNFITGR
jgi:60 kDa SS-A/Ro ribonucleoprotein